MLKKLAMLLVCGSLLAACETSKEDTKQTLGEMEIKTTATASTDTESERSKTEEQASAPVPQEAEGAAVPITWEDFFDNSDQTKPSEKFTSLQGKKVMFEGFMGEMVNMNAGWFLLIEQPGAECPFCSTDQSFWNRIMIVFVKEPDHLRYIPGKVQVTGTLDVGVKKDQSGYTTMFRLYHTEFKAAQ